MAEETQVQEPGTQEPDESVLIDYSNVDFDNVDDEGKIRNFEEVLIKPEKQEKTEEPETPEKTDQELDTATDSTVADSDGMDSFSDIQKHMEFLTQGFDDVPDLPGDKKDVKEDVKNVPDLKAPEEPEKPFQEKYLEQFNGVHEIYEHYLKRNNYDWETAKVDIENHFRNLAAQEEQRNWFEQEKESIKKEREALTKAKEVEASRPTYNKNMYEIAQERGWENSQQLHDYMYDQKGGGEVMWFLFNFKHPDSKFLNADELKQQWDNFNVEFGSDKKNLVFAEKLMRKLFVANNYTQVISKRVKAELAAKKDLERGKDHGPSSTKTVSKSTKPVSSFANWLRT